MGRVAPSRGPPRGGGARLFWVWDACHPRLVFADHRVSPFSAAATCVWTLFARGARWSRRATLCLPLYPLPPVSPPPRRVRWPTGSCRCRSVAAASRPPPRPAGVEAAAASPRWPPPPPATTARTRRGWRGGARRATASTWCRPKRAARGGGGGGRLELYFSAPAERALWWDALERAVQVRRPGGGVCAGGSLFSGWVAGVAAVAPGGPLGGGAGRVGQRRVLGAQWRRARAAGASREAKPRARPPRSDAEQF